MGTITIGGGLPHDYYNGSYVGGRWTATNGILSPNFGSSGGGGGTGSAGDPQQSFPTSAYGQTVPVVWGTARIPGGYIWAPEEPVEIDDDGRARLTARVRFARPLVADSRWSLKRVWRDGKEVYNASTGNRPSSIRPYDGYSTQGRDSKMVSVEGANNVSAHRGYLDIVFSNYNLGRVDEEFTGNPPAFDAEWIQDDAGSIDVDNFTGFFADAINTYGAADWENGVVYGVTSSGNFLRTFDIGSHQEINAVPVTGLLPGSGIGERGLHYVASIDRLVLSNTSGVDIYPTLVDPASGSVLDSSDNIGNYILYATAVVSFGTVGVLFSSTLTGVSTSQIFTHRFDASAIDAGFESTVGWDGRGLVQCFAVGEIRADDADVYAIAEDTLYKIVVNSSGGVLSVDTVYTDADDLAYCFYYDGDVIVWDDNATILRIEPSDGSTVWTAAVPYQIITSAFLRELAPPDMHRVTDELMVEEAAAYNFTNLDDGTTESVAKSSSTVGRQVYDGIGNVGINTDLGSSIARKVTFDAVGDGITRDLEDFFVDLHVAGGYDASQIEVENVDDQIRGVVIDITGGVRDITRQICEPYSISYFERADKIILRRALTDGSFAVEASIGSADILDAGGQAIQLTQRNPNEFVAKYGINYRDHEEIYQPRPQWGTIPSLPLAVAPTEIGIKADIGIISDADTMKVLAVKRVYRGAVEKHQFSMALRAEHLKIEPETIAQFTVASRLVTARVLEQTIHPNYTNTIVATEFLTSVSVAISGASGRPVEPEPIGTTSSRYYHLDIPLLSDTDDLVGSGFRQYHALTSAGQLTWSGATLFRKDGTGTYLAQGSQVEDGLVLVATEVLPDVDIPYVTEFTRTLTVARISGDADLLTSVTYNEMLAGANMFAIGQPGRWEVCHVQTITDNGDNTFTFETLRRGRGTSEEFTGLHELGDRVVWLSEDNIQSLEYTIASLDDAFDFKAVGIGGSLASTPTVYNNTVTGEAEKIPKPCHLDAVIDGADIDLAWVRRSRIGAYWPDDGDDTYTTPLGESLEQYVIRIKDGPGGSVLRTVTVDDVTAYTYTAANITTDFGSMPDDLTYDIRQVSGTGVISPTREETITL